MLFERDRLHLERDGAAWPNRDAGRIVKAAGLRIHVQDFRPGDPAPTLLLLHGTGASAHSFRDLAPLLARSFRTVVPDLPGHGFTEAPPSYRLSLPGMSAAIADLLESLGAAPDLVVGHSAGAAIALRMALDGKIAPKAIVSVNGALRPFQGAAAAVFPGLARALFVNPFTPRVFAWSAGDRRRVERLMASTGSEISADGLAQYAALFRNPAHVAGALGMMAHWRLEPLVADLPKLDRRLVLVVGAKDGTVPPSVSAEAAERAPRAEIVAWRDCGHLAHEEQPGRTAALLNRIAAEEGLASGLAADATGGGA